MIPVESTIFMECQVSRDTFYRLQLTISSAGLFGGLLSVLMAGIASPDSYDKFSHGMEDKRWVGACTQIYSDFILFSLTEIFPALAEGGTAAGQALSQLLAIIVTLAFAIVGGLVTGQ